MITRFIRTGVVLATTGAGVLLYCATVSAHHSVALQYDMTKEVTVSGAIVELRAHVLIGSTRPDSACFATLPNNLGST